MSTQSLIKNSLNAKKFPTKGEKNTLPSMTIPDMSYTIQEILIRFSKGLPVTGNTAKPVYNGEMLVPDVKKMDISEIANLRDFMKEKIEARKQESERIGREKREKEQKEFDEWKKQKTRADTVETGNSSPQTENAPSTNQSPT